MAAAPTRRKCGRRIRRVEMMMLRRLLPIVSMATLAGCAAGAASGGSQAPETPAAAPAADYWVYVGAESADLVHRIRFGPGGAEVEQTTPVGELAVETEGPHGLAISRDGRYLYMTTAHGFPDGKLWKLELGPDTVVGTPIHLGHMPATLDVTPDGLYAFAVNFNLHGEMVPSSVSVVYTPGVVEVARPVTCTMPHGSRISPQGTHQYSACMMDDQLVEIDTRTFEVSRRFSVARGAEGAVEAKAAEHEGHDAAMGGHGDAADHEPSCAPTWAQPSARGDRIYVACNKSDEILEVSFADWTLLRRFPTGRGPYNLAVTPDGRLLVATLKQGGAVEFFDLERGRSLATVPSSTTVTHGAVVSPDSRYAFISNEAKGAQPGKVDIYDLRTFTRVASVPVGQQAGGIAFWKMEAAR